jgi:hypothetical protein
MNTTDALPSAIQQIQNQLSQIPRIDYASIALENLTKPEELFDAKSPALLQTPVSNAIPILAAKTGSGDNYVIVDGCKRFQIFKGNHTAQCTCGIFQKVLDEKSIGLLRMLFNKSRPTSLRESMLFFKWLQRNYSKELYEKIAQEVGLNVFELKPLISCSEDAFNAVAEGKINIRNALDFELLNERDQKVFLETFKGLLLSQQMQREFLEWLPEISFSKNISLKELLESKDLLTIMSNASLNNPQKIESLRELFFSWKFPAFNTTLKRWKTSVGAVTREILENDPSSRIAFIANPAFEKNKLELRISVEHARAATELFEKLSRIPQNTWAQLIYPVEE